MVKLIWSCTSSSRLFTFDRSCTVFVCAYVRACMYVRVCKRVLFYLYILFLFRSVYLFAFSFVCFSILHAITSAITNAFAGVRCAR